MSDLSAFVMLENFVQPDMKVVAAAIRARHPDTTTTVPDGHGEQSPIILCAGKIAIVMALPAPLPHDDGVIKRTATTWPQAGEAYGRHRAHLIVSMMANNPKSQADARVMMAVIGGIIAAVPGCIGVVWRSEVLLPSDIWLQMSQAAFAPYPDFPFMLWVAIHPFRYDSGSRISGAWQMLTFHGKVSVDQDQRRFDMSAYPVNSSTSKRGRQPKARKFYEMVLDLRVCGRAGHKLENESVLLQGQRLLSPPAGRRGFPDYPEPPRFLFDEKLAHFPRDLELCHSYWLVSNRMKTVLETSTRNVQ